MLSRLTGRGSEKPSALDNSRAMKTFSVIAVVLIFVVGLGVMLFKQQGKKAVQQLEPPQALATDLPNWWYKQYFGSSVCDKQDCLGESDPDGDKLTNAQEFYYQGNPVKGDTNGNGKNDGEDVAAGIDPSRQGETTFSSAESDDNVFGESLLFSQDIQDELQESLDPNKVVLPLPDNSQLNLGSDNSPQALEEYLNSVTSISSKYLTRDYVAYAEAAFQSNDNERLKDLQLRAGMVEKELTSVSVPPELVPLHKYTIAYFSLLKIIAVPPPQDVLSDNKNPVGNKWFDSVQAFMVVADRMGQEFSRLQQKYK